MNEHTCEIENEKLHRIGSNGLFQVVQIGVEPEGEGTEQTDEEIQKMEHFLSGPAVIWNTQFDSRQLNLPQAQGIEIHVRHGGRFTHAAMPMMA